MDYNLKVVNLQGESNRIQEMWFLHPIVCLNEFFGMLVHFESYSVAIVGLDHGQATARHAVQEKTAKTRI